MVATSSRILSCGVWLILMRKMSAPASNRRRIIARSDDAGPRVARILIRRRRLMACFRALRRAADQTRPEAPHPEAPHPVSPDPYPVSPDPVSPDPYPVSPDPVSPDPYPVSPARWAGPEPCRPV